MGQKGKADLGSCPYCGENLIESKAGWGCSNFRGGCKAFIFKNDNFFKKVIGRDIRKDEALKLIMGDTIHLKNIVIKGKSRDLNLTWGQNEEGSKYPFGYKMEFLGEDRKETLYNS